MMTDASVDQNVSLPVSVNSSEEMPYYGEIILTLPSEIIRFGVWSE
jgi:hypothetical protein